MTRSFTDRIFGGVCGGIGQATRINPWLLRLVVLILSVLSLGVGAVGYVILWWLLPQESPIVNTRGGFIRFVVTVGVIALLTVVWFGDRSGWLDDGLLLPAIILILGVTLTIKQLRNPIWGAILLVIGGVLLLHGLEAIPEGLYDLLSRAWSGILVLIGLVLLLRGRIPFSTIVATALSVILVGAIAFTAYNSRVNQTRDDQQIAINQPIDDVISLLVINVDMSTTDISLLPGSQNARVTGTFAGSTESEINVQYNDSAGSTAEMTIEETASTQFPLLEAIGRGTLELEVPTGIAVVINVVNQNGRVTMSLSDLQLELLTLRLEHGDAVVTLPSHIPISLDPQERPSQLTVQNGSIIIFVPDELDAQFELNRGSNRPDFPASYLLVDDGADGTLQKRGVSDFSMYYEVTVPTGSITLATDEE